ncbi:MAG: chromate transporter [Eubacteriales bacterium]|nr:chromate transporter [Eubacteriales bacterium]
MSERFRLKSEEASTKNLGRDLRSDASEVLTSTVDVDPASDAEPEPLKIEGMGAELSSAERSSTERPGKMRLLLSLFFDMLYISSFTFGGGFVIITFMKNRFVHKRGFLSETEMLDLIAIAQASPGSIAVNAAILVGSQVAGIAGVAAAVIGTMIPPIAILSIISLFYQAFASNLYVARFLKGMQAGVAAVILDVVFCLAKSVFSFAKILDYLLAVGAFILVFFFKLNVIFVVLSGLVIGILRAIYIHRQRILKSGRSQR